MPDMQLPQKMMRDLAETNPETLGASADPFASFRYVDLSAVSVGAIDWNACLEFTLSNAPSRARRVLRKGDVLFGTVRPGLQSHGFVDGHDRGILVGSTGFSVIRAKPGMADPRFLFHCVMSNGVAEQANRHAVGSSYPALNDSDVQRFSVFAPPIEAQRSIAQVLDTLDTTIRQTEAIIEKLKQVKQGLLHDLLTRGIDANGELRPPQSEAPHLYKASPLGWVPTDWTDCALGTVLAGIDGGWSPDCQEVPPPEGCWGVLKLSAITSGKYLASESKTLPDTLLPDPSIEVHAGDVLLARANGVAELVATTVFVDSTPSRLMLSDKTLRLRPVARLLSSRFLALLMAFDTTRRQIRGMLNGSSGQQNISQRQIANLVVALPSFSEQQAIEARLEAANLRISSEAQTEEKLRRAKSGLMDDLLTGRVRVTPLLAKQAA
nr:restriction endonuclease subunit S [uncultured Aquabacterium sp.]